MFFSSFSLFLSFYLFTFSRLRFSLRQDWSFSSRFLALHAWRQPHRRRGGSRLPFFSYFFLFLMNGSRHKLEASRATSAPDFGSGTYYYYYFIFRRRWKFVKLNNNIIIMEDKDERKTNIVLTCANVHVKNFPKWIIVEKVFIIKLWFYDV